ncbi:MAG: hypothetical protein AVDCRST_MAG27-369 [uncultured Craurococcus sp.]|uniref:Uncharacterized protein n=1 Tax=uncultured Craurococcus sp. TaxID=1135998 RepID=A0A6J4HBI6_9PROT|nr:MAG: hypothetical protein AVDCRST_MAG27-369 [uncultured Craurococcus sp.]
MRPGPIAFPPRPRDMTAPAGAAAPGTLGLRMLSNPVTGPDMMETKRIEAAKFTNAQAT